MLKGRRFTSPLFLSSSPPGRPIRRPSCGGQASPSLATAAIPAPSHHRRAASSCPPVLYLIGIVICYNLMELAYPCYLTQNFLFVSDVRTACPYSNKMVKNSKIYINRFLFEKDRRRVTRTRPAKRERKNHVSSAKRQAVGLETENALAVLFFRNERVKCPWDCSGLGSAWQPRTLSGVLMRSFHGTFPQHESDGAQCGQEPDLSLCPSVLLDESPVQRPAREFRGGRCGRPCHPGTDARGYPYAGTRPRNANDAVSLIQTADGALAIIDEKLIRMKELAEQAATGTYDSIQRLLIESEYQQMASEIDRIANSTAFNGVKLLDGSLSGVHDGSGLSSTGALKVHFGTANDSAEDYYYITIGNCTAGALGVGSTSQYTEAGVTRVRVETLVETQQTFKQKNTYTVYVDPDSGKTYYTDGEIFYENPQKPFETALDAENDKEIIERLQMKNSTRTTEQYDEYYDSVDGKIYYKQKFGNRYTTDINNFYDGLVDQNSPNYNDLINRLTATGNDYEVVITWNEYKDPNGVSYYTCNNGKTFVKNVSRPTSNILSSVNPDDRKIIDTLNKVVEQKTFKMTTYIEFITYQDPVTQKRYYSNDNLQTVYTTANPNSTPFLDSAVINRLVVLPKQEITYTIYKTFIHSDTNVKYYSFDNGKTFYTENKLYAPEFADLSAGKDDAEIAKLTPVNRTLHTYIEYQVYRDQRNPSLVYYSADNKQTIFTDLNDPSGSIIDKSDPNYADIMANIVDHGIVKPGYDLKVYNKINTLDRYYSLDGKNFYYDQQLKNKVTDNSLIAMLRPEQENKQISIPLDSYIDKTTNKKYYTMSFWSKTNYLTNPKDFTSIALSKNNPGDLDTIANLEPVSMTTNYIKELPYPAEYLVYEDVRTGLHYYTADDGASFAADPTNPTRTGLDPNDPADKLILDNLRPSVTTTINVTYEERFTGEATAAAGYTISTQEAAQRALVAIDRAIVSKDAIRAHLGALQNRLENTVTKLTIQAENLQNAESRISDVDVAQEMTQFVRNQVLTQSATAMLSQANSFPHMLLSLIG